MMGRLSELCQDALMWTVLGFMLGVILAWAASDWPVPLILLMGLATAVYSLVRLMRRRPFDQLDITPPAPHAPTYAWVGGRYLPVFNSLSDDEPADALGETWSTEATNDLRTASRSTTGALYRVSCVAGRHWAGLGAWGYFSTEDRRRALLREDWHVAAAIADLIEGEVELCEDGVWHPVLVAGVHPFPDREVMRDLEVL